MQPYFWLGADAERPENWVPVHVVFEVGTPTTPENGCNFCKKDHGRE